jgi:hypothetical protein
MLKKQLKRVEVQACHDFLFCLADAELEVNPASLDKSVLMRPTIIMPSTLRKSKKRRNSTERRKVRAEIASVNIWIVRVGFMTAKTELTITRRISDRWQPDSWMVCFTALLPLPTLYYCRCPCPEAFWQCSPCC